MCRQCLYQYWEHLQVPKLSPCVTQVPDLGVPFINDVTQVREEGVYTYMPGNVVTEGGHKISKFE